MDRAREILSASLNIQLGKAGGVKAALGALYQVNVIIGLLQEQNLTMSMNTQYSMGYILWSTEAKSLH